MKLDSLLTSATLVVWLFFTLYAVFSFSIDLREKGLRHAFARLFSTRLLLPFSLAIGLSFLSASLVFVQPQEIGVVISVLQPQGYRDRPIRPGLKFVVPLAEQVVTYPLSWQTYTMSSKPVAGETLGDDAIAARTKDGQEVFLDCSTIFRIDPEQVIRVHIDWQNRYLNDFLRTQVRGLVRSQVANYKIDEVNSEKRQIIENELDKKLRTILAEKGFILDKFILRNIAFSPEYAKSVEDKQIALQGQIQREYEAVQIQKLAEGQARKIEILAKAEATATVLRANAEAAARTIRAQAERDALQMINQALVKNPKLLTYEYIAKLSPNIRVMLVPNNAPIMLPLATQDLGLAPEGSTSPLTTTEIFTNSSKPVEVHQP